MFASMNTLMFLGSPERRKFEPKYRFIHNQFTYKSSPHKNKQQRNKLNQDYSIANRINMIRLRYLNDT